MVAYTLFIFPFLRNVFFPSSPDGLSLIIIWRLTRHTKYLQSLPCTLVSSSTFVFLLPEDLNRAMLSLESCNSLTGLLLPYLSILSTVTIVSHLNGISDLVSPQLKTLHWVPISFSPDKALHLMACVTSLTSPHTVSWLPYHLAALLFIELLRQTLGSGHMHLPFSLPETFFSK